ncbi:MAG: type II toxin-antitoxin system RelE/ParE family toxin [Methanofollis sp.]|jgi:mRNA interferase RelE/StbE|uniref:type II toxin-antitoxin system RelE family toxin n=1 Tax=unclassified Methanofollis TaxID=2634179 RepID=UPI002634CD47|nr:type II toxin-antitoxin system RelE/ParE family toxin [Methanofollis sp.]MDD4255180.1 type II toxin-antitoxin system RelE/ParE family toxin [Methanofollis sp.]
MSYRVFFSATARRDIKRIPKDYALAIGEELMSLAGETDPKRHVKKIQGGQNPPFYSLRVGEYRAILTIVDDVMVIHVIEVGHRRTVYRKY